ncbi:unnamed protein product [Eruca vesicaria subsp. sativa]|uniref:Uncharacterized protein n=1 Tax=Eruca vesicaria subsp. sativa TaxID=29727 RepID=A0ABC8K2V6_ERUVS|nr:unnamed protein product [Eruca vesicaria subsp. sativa]
MLHKILSMVATNHLGDFGSARVALPAFNQIGREEYFYKSADLIHFNDWIDEVNVVRTYMLKCYQAGNPQAIYMRAFSGYDRGLVHNFPTFAREFADQMNHMLATEVSSGHWGYEKPQIFMSLLEKIDPNINYNCWCAEMMQPVFVVTLDGSRTRWKCNCCFWQCAVWDFCNDIHWTASKWPI